MNNLFTCCGEIFVEGAVCPQCGQTGVVLATVNDADLQEALFRSFSFTDAEARALLKHPAIRMDKNACEALGLTLPVAEFLRWLFIEGKRTSAQIRERGWIDVARATQKAHGVRTRFGDNGNCRVVYWEIVPKGIALLKRVLED
jgi:hypothetical protein